MEKIKEFEVVKDVVVINGCLDAENGFCVVRNSATESQFNQVLNKEFG